MTTKIGPGSVIAGRYQVEAQIGQGGMASVYRAEDIQLGRKVAVKVLHAQFAEDQEFVERFRREAKAAAQLQHPGIVSVYDTGSWNGTWYIAMELLEGPSLKERLVSEGRIPPAQAIAITEQILRAVRAAHRDGIIHRDIKPHNVLLDEEGRPKVTDFGIARRGASDMTATGSILGTAHYIAPEQAQGEVITPRTDLYSVGVVLYEMLTGRTPFEGDSAVSIALAHVNNEPRSPRSLVPEVSPALDAVVLRALAKRPSDRFADADAFLAALADAARGIAPVYAPPTGEHAAAATDRRGITSDRRALTGEQDPVVTPWYKRPWVIALGALVVIGVVVALLLTSSTQRVRVPDVVGASLGTAQDRLEADGFDVSIVRSESNKPIDTVLAQKPGAGAQADKGAEVRLTVSSGPGQATVPQVEGETREVAVERLETAGFRTKIERQDSEDVESGNVIETSPPGGSIASRATVVTVTVSSGPKEVDVPDVTGQPEDAARSTLDELGLRVQVSEQESDDKEPGTVLSQDPAGGGKARVGDTVKITVATEPSKVSVPDVIGRSQATATKRLQNAGLGVRATTEETTNADQVGRVISSDPAAGAQVDKASEVTIVIGKAPDASDPTTPENTTP
ncbi:MAG: Stk1 family PASTA domain-containing Ser/Thr kinase [Solirubrobacteraceae bacterium]|nr:Stk1 family PASTA domain-containing Ser/Thr kinase [Solirubrobacteraceae bacterium]